MPPTALRQEDLTSLSDDDLVFRARQGHSLAVITLFQRHRRWLRGVVAQQLRSWPWLAGEREDAFQETFFTFLNAIRRYDPGLARGPRECRFRRYLGRRVASAVANFAHRRWCEERRRQRGVTAAVILDALVVRELGDRLHAAHYPGIEEPWMILAGRESWERLESKVRELGPDAELLWEQRSAGHSLHVIARENEWSYATVKRRWQHLGKTVRDDEPEGL